MVSNINLWFKLITQYYRAESIRCIRYRQNKTTLVYKILIEKRYKMRSARLHYFSL